MVARLNSNGTLDTSFGTGGQVITALTAGDTAEAAVCMTIDPTGNIVVGGRAIPSSGNQPRWKSWR